MRKLNAHVHTTGVVIIADDYSMLPTWYGKESEIRESSFDIAIELLKEEAEIEIHISWYLPPVKDREIREFIQNNRVIENSNGVKFHIYCKEPW